MSNIKKILVVEDDQDMLKNLVDGFAKDNYEIYQALDGEEAITLTVDKKPDLILLDLLLPKLDGFKVLERIRNFPDQTLSNTKVVILSNLWSNKDILRAEALKIDGYFVKANTKLEEVFDKARSLMNNAPV